jgi:hypothetical protein
MSLKREYIISPTPEELAECFLDMGSSQQAEVLDRVGRQAATRWGYSAERQWCFVGEALAREESPGLKLLEDIAGHARFYTSRRNHAG